MRRCHERVCAGCNTQCPRLEDGGGSGAAKAASRVERINAEQLVDEAAGDAHHRRAAVLALGVQLEGLDLGVVVAHPRVERDVARLAVGVLRLGSEAGASLLHAGEDHDLQPSRGGHGLERREAASGHVLELEVLRGGEVAWHADARLDGDHVEEAKHGGAAVLDLHDLVAAHVARLDEAERVKDAERGEDANVALREHLDVGERARRLHGRGLEGLHGLEERKGNDSDGLHGSGDLLEWG
mmetsp:Transcript_74787/g.200476  ORF Transcript_74787/g.200476 Transcript_74787/m.200476 type:complete len:241 (-) Transcript_74787:4-726(-)